MAHFSTGLGARTLYGEAFLYPAIYEVAKGRKWSVHAQVPLKRSKKKRNLPGAPESIDFIISRSEEEYDDPGLIFLEVKYLRNTNATSDLRGLADDMAKLRKIDETSVELASSISDCGAPRKVLLVVAQREAYAKLAVSKTKKHAPISKMLADALHKNLPRSVYRSIIETKLKKELHCHVFAFAEPSWPPPAKSARKRITKSVKVRSSGRQ